jgi:uncharacterized membrane protein
VPATRSGDRAPGWRVVSPYLLAGLLITTGTLHFLVPRTFQSIVPPQLPEPRALVHLSGAAELACAAGLVVPRLRRRAGWATAALFVAVFPGNVQMALDASGRSALYRAATYARLPVQVPLVAWAVQVARVNRRSSG